MATSSPADCFHGAGLEASQILAPSDAEFEYRQSSYYSLGAGSLRPACIVQPRSAKDVSIAVRALTAAQVPFAVRSGGHTNWAGASSIGSEGVTIDLGRMDWVRLRAQANEDQGTVDLGPAALWGNVYKHLEAQGLTVAGSREGSVGVGGLILGGGWSFLTGQYGLVCDSIVEFEVVLADGRIVKAREDGEHADLFRALKGGSNNFGIVTNFRMRTLPSPAICGCSMVHSKEMIPDAIQALKEFTDDAEKDVDSLLFCFFTYLPQFKDVVIAGSMLNMAGVEEAPAHKKWRQMPAIATMSKSTTMAQATAQPTQAWNYHNTWFTALFKNDVRIVSKAAELHNEFVDELKALIPDGDFITQCLFQPFPRLYGQVSAAAGGNVTGIEKQQHNGLLLLAVAQVRTAEQDKFANPRVREWVEALRQFAATIDDGEGDLGWTYLNYADKSQDPLGSYGPENVRFMRDVATKYDPGQVFQRLCPGGFKLLNTKLPS